MVPEASERCSRRGMRTESRSLDSWDKYRYMMPNGKEPGALGRQELWFQKSRQNGQVPVAVS